MFRIGQRVVCVDDSEWEDFGEKFPVRGCVYTVRDLTDYPDGITGITLVEIINKPQLYRGGVVECNFAHFRFRPIVERKTDISIFTAMLTGTKVDA